METPEITELKCLIKQFVCSGQGLMECYNTLLRLSSQHQCDELVTCKASLMTYQDNMEHVIEGIIQLLGDEEQGVEIHRYLSEVQSRIRTYAVENGGNDRSGYVAAYEYNVFAAVLDLTAAIKYSSNIFLQSSIKRSCSTLSVRTDSASSVVDIKFGQVHRDIEKFARICHCILDNVNDLTPSHSLTILSDIKQLIIVVKDICKLDVDEELLDAVRSNATNLVPIARRIMNFQDLNVEMTLNLNVEIRSNIEALARATKKCVLTFLSNSISPKIEHEDSTTLTPESTVNIHSNENYESLDQSETVDPNKDSNISWWNDVTQPNEWSEYPKTPPHDIFKQRTSYSSAAEPYSQSVNTRSSRKSTFIKFDQLHEIGLTAMKATAEPISDNFSDTSEASDVPEVCRKPSLSSSQLNYHLAAVHVDDDDEEVGRWSLRCNVSVMASDSSHSSPQLQKKNSVLALFSKMQKLIVPSGAVDESTCLFVVRIVTTVPDLVLREFWIQRRYSQFLTLHSALSKVVPGELDDLPSFTERSCVNTAYMKTRCAAVKSLLLAASGNLHLLTSRIFRDFLLDNQLTYDPDPRLLEDGGSSVSDYCDSSSEEEELSSPIFSYFTPDSVVVDGATLLSEATVEPLTGTDEYPQRKPSSWWPNFTKRDSEASALSFFSKPFVSEVVNSEPADKYKEEEHPSVVVNENGVDVLILTWNTSRYVISAGTIEHLVERLADESDRQDSLYLTTFLLCYRHFVQAYVLLNMLIRRYNERPAPDSDEDVKDYFSKYRRLIQLRVVNVVKKWMERSWFDFYGEPGTKGASCKVLLESFLEELQLPDSGFKRMATKMTQLKERKDAELRERLTFKVINGHRRICSTLITELPVELLARQFSLIDLELFQRVTSEEISLHLWGTTQPLRTQLCSNLSAYIDRFNTVSFWAATEICTQPILKQRIAVLEKIIDIMKYSCELNNYNVVMSIMSGLMSSSIQRLKKTWEGLSTSHASTMAKLELLMNPQSNYVMYRREQSKHYSVFVPFFGLFLKDITFMNENPIKLQNGLIDFSKVFTIAEKMYELRYFQKTKYNFSSDDRAYGFSRNVFALPENRLYQYSLKCEPRGNDEQLRLIEKWAKH